MTIQCRAQHTSFPVHDLSRSREFYEGTLGLTEIERPDVFGVAGAWYDAGAVQVHLIEVPDDIDVGSPPPACDPRARHAAFAVDDYQTTVDLLKSRDIEVFETNAEFGQCWVQDPDGHVIEFIAVAPEPDEPTTDEEANAGSSS